MSVLSRPYEERDGSQFQAYENFSVEYRDASHRYWLHVDGERIPAISVTSALKVLDKPALIAWAEAAGAEGAVILERQGSLKGVPPQGVAEQVRLHGLGADAKRDKGADRGTLTHDVLELWAREQKVPNLGDYRMEIRGYVQGLCRWLLDSRPEVSSVERFVGSVEHSYAGRLDMRAEIAGRDCLVDLKTNPKGRVYDEAHYQSRAYALADVECGQDPPEGIIIVAVGQDGRYEVVECEAETRDWLNVLACSKSARRLGSARQARWRAAKAALEAAA